MKNVYKIFVGNLKKTENHMRGFGVDESIILK
jgi:hypothetical protein